MSNKAKTSGRVNMAVKLGTVFVASFLTFLGFTGLERVTVYAGWVSSLTREQVEFAFNLGVFALFVLIMLHLIFRFSEREAEASRAIVFLTHLINEVDDMVLRGERGYQITESDLSLVREKYDTLLMTLPSNSDSEYLRARKDIRDKEERKLTLQLSARELFDAQVHRRAVESVIREPGLIMTVLQVLRDTDERLYLGGGAIRNALWDHLHGYDPRTSLDDVDVTYFDQVAAEKAHDEAIEQRLRGAMRNIRWSVKNQARMHVVNREPPYRSLEDAISKWPETATALVARLHQDDEIEILAPYGFDDLFRLIVQPTPHFDTRMAEYRSRLERKKWEENWPKLKFVGRTPVASVDERHR